MVNNVVGAVEDVVDEPSYETKLYLNTDSNVLSTTNKPQKQELPSPRRVNHRDGPPLPRMQEYSQFDTWQDQDYDWNKK